MHTFQEKRMSRRFRTDDPIRRITFGGFVLLLIVGSAAIVSSGCDKKGGDAAKGTDSSGAKAGGSEQGAKEDPVTRGKFLVTIGGCNDCHTPLKIGDKGPEPDMTRMLSGHPAELKMPAPPKVEGPWQIGASATLTAWSGPWGVSYTANLTPDTLTGIGNWTEELFIKTLTSGKHYGTSRPIMPPMPWPAIAGLPQDDLKAIYAYLRTIPPINNQVPAYQPPAGAPAM